MSKGRQNARTLARLLGVKEALPTTHKEVQRARPADLKVAPETEGAEPEAPQCCVICGYDVRGQIVDRCPECGLLLASKYRDPTLWDTARPRILGWLQTAWSICGWDHRIVVRTSFLPATKQARRFATWSIGMAAPAFGCALAILNYVNTPLTSVRVSIFLLAFIIGTVVGVGLLAGTLYGTVTLLTGRWRGFRYAPATLYYSSAWWCATAWVLLASACVCAIAGLRTILPTVATILGLAGLVLWGLWTWDSISSSERIPHSLRSITGVALISAVLGILTSSWLSMVLTPATSRAVAAVKKMDAALSGGIASQGPRTYALVITAQPDRDRAMILNRLRSLGARAGDLTVLEGSNHTIEAVRARFTQISDTIQKEDKLILHIGGHEGSDRPETIELAGGVLSTKELIAFLLGLPTQKSLVVIDSEAGGAFVRGLRGRCDAVVVAANKRRNVLFQPTVTSFWEALADPKADSDGDASVTVGEAIDFLRPIDGDPETLLCEQLGEASADDFAVRILLVNGRIPTTPLVSRAPRTFALIFDQPPSDGIPLALTRVGRLGVPPDDRMVIQHNHQMPIVLADAIAEIREHDKLILYLAGYSVDSDNRDYYLSPRSFEDFLKGLDTTDVLVVVDGDGAKSVSDSLEGARVSAAVVASWYELGGTGNQRFDAFWTAFDEPEADRNTDGKVSVSEAYRHACPRQNPPQEGCDALRLLELGSASAGDFRAHLPP